MKYDFAALTEKQEEWEYSFLDCGNGKRLERFGSFLVERPAAFFAAAPGLAPEFWKRAHFRYHIVSGKGEWEKNENLPLPWIIRMGPVRMELRLASGGQVGIFPEQKENWEWIFRKIRQPGRPSNILNVFAYSGIFSLFAAAAGKDIPGSEVVHVDASRGNIAWARNNAVHSGILSGIRWIPEDVITFLKREIRRRRKYAGLIIDPPAFGRSPGGGKTWKLSRDLPELLRLSHLLLEERRSFLLLSSHDPRMTPGILKRNFILHLGRPGKIISENLTLKSRAGGNSLRLGAFLRWESEP